MASSVYVRPYVNATLSLFTRRLEKYWSDESSLETLDSASGFCTRSIAAARETHST